MQILCLNSWRFHNSLHRQISSSIISSLLIVTSPDIGMARPEGVNRPDLLPKSQTSLIDTANFLS